MKGLVNLIDAWKRVAGPDWRLRIVGPDENGHCRELRRQVSALNLQSQVTFCSAIHSDVKWKLMQQAGLLVLPSFSENFGIVVAEALGMGTPVITTTGTPWNEVLSRRCGWYVEPTAEGIASALAAATSTTPAELRAMGDRGRRWVREAFSWPAIGKKMLAGYEWLLGRGECGDWIQDDEPTTRNAA